MPTYINLPATFYLHHHTSLHRFINHRDRKILILLVTFLLVDYLRYSVESFFRLQLVYLMMNDEMHYWLSAVWIDL